jgi:hypothetical protein
MEHTKFEVERESNYSELGEGHDPERRLWAAALLQAVEDWRSNNMRAHRAAESFLFNSGIDFETVCQGAGFDPVTFQSKLRHLRDVRIMPVARRKYHVAA